MAWLGSWAKRFEIIVDAAKIDADLTDFPLTLHLSADCGTNNHDATPVFDEIGSNKLKIAITTSNGTSECFGEIEYWDATGEIGVIHAKIPSISQATNERIFLYFDNAQADNTTYIGDVASTVAKNVWDANYTHIFHLSESGNGTTDEYKNSAATNHGTGGASKYPDRVSGMVGYAQGFGNYTDGEYIQVDGADPDGGTEITFESIFKPGSGECVNGTHKAMVMNPGGNINGCFYLAHHDVARVFIYTTGGFDFVDGATALTGGSWYYSAGRWKSGEKITVWLDDAQDGEASGTRSGTISRGQVDQFEIGNWHQASEYELRNGQVDEVRISDVKRTDAWLKATYYTLFDDLLEWAPPGEVDDGIGIDDQVDGFNLTDEITDQVGLADDVDAFNQMGYSDDQVSIDDQIFGTVEYELSELSHGIQVSVVADAWIFPGRLADDIALNVEMQGGFEFTDSISDGVGLSDQIDGLNWTQWLNENGDIAIKRFFFTLTGAEDDLDDLSVPISGFQARKRSGYDTYLSVTVPGFTYASDLSARPNGQMVVEMGYEINGQIEVQQEILRVDLSRVDLAKGSRNRSVTLTGYKTQTFDNQISYVRNPNYKSTTDGRILYRFNSIDPYVNPGDTCIVENDQFTIDYISYTISGRAHIMEIKET